MSVVTGGTCRPVSRRRRLTGPGAAPHADPPPGGPDPVRPRAAGAVDRRPDRTELRLRPVPAPEALVPGDHRDAPAGEAPEQGRAPPLPVEHQRQRGLRRRVRREVRRVRPGPLQGREDVVLQRPDHAGVGVPVQARQRPAAQSVHPVAGAGRQAELLARHEVLPQAAPAAGVDLHVPVHRQRGDGVATVRDPAPRQRVLPVPDALRGARGRPGPAPRRPGLRAPVQAGDRAPLARRPVAERPGVADPGQEHEGRHGERARQAVVSPRQRQPVGVLQQPLLQERRRRGQDAAAGDRRQRLAEGWPRLVQRARRGRDAARAVVRGAPHRRRPVAQVPFAAVEKAVRWLPAVPGSGRRVRLRRSLRGLRPGRSGPDEAPVDVVVHRRGRDAGSAGHGRAAHAPGQEPVRLLRLPAGDHAGAAPLPRRVERRLAFAPEPVDRPLQRRTADPERRLDVRAADAAPGEPGGARQHRAPVGRAVEVGGLEVVEAGHPSVRDGEREAGVAGPLGLRGQEGKGAHGKRTPKYGFMKYRDPLPLCCQAKKPRRANNCCRKNALRNDRCQLTRSGHVKLAITTWET